MPESTLTRGPVVSDELWARIEPLLPVKPRRFKHPGRFPLSDRAVLSGLLVVLARGIAFDQLPTDLGFGSGMTCWRRLRDWQRAGAWPAVERLLAEGLPAGHGVDFQRASCVAAGPAVDA